MFSKTGIMAVALMAFLAAPLAMAEDAPKTDAATAENRKAEPAEAQQGDRPDVPAGEIGIKGSRRTVMFSHEKGHKDLECVACHHLVDGKKNFAKCATAGCHDDLKAKKGENSLYFVMHSKSEELRHQTCMSCHLKVIAEKPDLKKDLTGCSGSFCHPKKKSEDGDEAEKEKS